MLPLAAEKEEVQPFLYHVVASSWWWHQCQRASRSQKQDLYPSFAQYPFQTVLTCLPRESCFPPGKNPIAEIGPDFPAPFRSRTPDVGVGLLEGALQNSQPASLSPWPSHTSSAAALGLGRTCPPLFPAPSGFRCSGACSRAWETKVSSPNVPGPQGPCSSDLSRSCCLQGPPTLERGIMSPSIPTLENLKSPCTLPGQALTAFLLPD